MKRRTGSISRRLIINIGILIIIICTAFSFISIKMMSTAIEDTVYSSLAKLTHQATETVNERINSHYKSLETLAENELFEDIERNRAQIKDIMRQTAEKNDIYDMMVSDPQGNAYSILWDEIDIAQRPYFQKAMNGINSVSDPLMKEGDDKLVSTFSVPIKTKNGKIIGTLSAVRDGFELSDLIKDITYGETGYTYILNNFGEVIAHPDSSYVTGNEYDLAAIKDNTELTELIEMVDDCIARKAGHGLYTYQGERKYLSYAPVEGTIWSIAITGPENELFEESNKLRTFLIIVSVVCIFVGIVIAIFISNSIKKPIKAAAEHANILAQGNFSLDIPEAFLSRKDEFGILAKSYKTLTDNMNELIANIRTAADQVSSGAKQISSSSTELSQGATEQASSIEELTATIEEISTQTKLNAENASNTNKLAADAKNYADEGNNKMKQMLRSMEDINTSSNNISKIIKVIDDIAFQTNILALNAAVEAARAGQHGKGFAVVADEVRNLAARSAAAAKETTELIEGSINKVNEGTKIADSTAEELKRIADGITKAAELVNNIAIASNEQAAGITQVNDGIMQVSKVVQVNSATSEEAAAASEELSGQAEMLEEQIAKFMLKDMAEKPISMNTVDEELVEKAEDKPTEKDKKKSKPKVDKDKEKERDKPKSTKRSKSNNKEKPIKEKLVKKATNKSKKTEQDETPEPKEFSASLSDNEFGKY